MTFREIVLTPGFQTELGITYTENNQTITLDNDDITKIRQYFNANITGSIMQCAEIEIGQKIPDGTTISVSIKVKYGTDEQTRTFSYKIKDSSYEADSKTYIHNACDLLLDWMVTYSTLSSVTFPCTVQTYFAALCTAMNCTAGFTLPNGSLTLSSDIYNGIGMTYRDVLDDICNANGIRVEKSGSSIVRRELGTTTFTINDDILMNSNITTNEHYGPINLITMNRTGFDAAYYPSTLPQTIHDYVIQDNQMLNRDDRLTYAAEIFDELEDLEFDTYDLSLIGVGGFDPLEKITISTNSLTFDSYVFNGETTWEGGNCSDTIYAEYPTFASQEYEYATGDTKKDREAKIIVDKLNSDLSLTGKTINLTADSIQIASTYFNVDSTGALTCTSGTFSGLLNTSSNCTVGNNLYVGQNQATTGLDMKFIRFSNNTYISRLYFSELGSESLVVAAQNTLSLNAPSVTCTQFARGTITLYGNQNTYQSFGKTFTSAPTVMLTSCHDGTSTAYVGNVVAVDQYGFQAFRSGGGSTAITFNWIAVGIN